MEWKMEWNGTEILVWNMEDARMEWNGRQSSILPYQFHIRFRALYLQKNTHQFRVVIKYCHRSTRLQYLRILFVDKLRYFSCVHYANSVPIASLQVHCNLIAALMLQFTTLIDLTCFFFSYFVADNLPGRKFCFLTSRVFLHIISYSYLLFHLRFCLILFIFLVFKLIVILFGVKA